MGLATIFADSQSNQKSLRILHKGSAPEPQKFKACKIKSVNPPLDTTGAVNILPWPVLIFLYFWRCRLRLLAPLATGRYDAQVGRRAISGIGELHCRIGPAVVAANERSGRSHPQYKDSQS